MQGLGDASRSPRRDFVELLSTDLLIVDPEKAQDRLRDHHRQG
ncbi:hypothetical protein ACFVFQ_31755 [Streptomyces sp. NPDC057743]